MAQQVKLHPLQLLQITSEVLGQLKVWAEAKRGTPDDSHPHKTIEAITSLHHARLLCNVRLQEMARQIQAAQEAERKKVMERLPTQNQLNMQAAQVVGQNTAAKTIEDLWREAGLDHYYNTGRP